MNFKINSGGIVFVPLTTLNYLLFTIKFFLCLQQNQDLQGLSVHLLQKARLHIKNLPGEVLNLQMEDPIHRAELQEPLL